MIKSDSIKTIAPALLAAQKNIGAAKKASENPFFHSTYADLGAVMEVCKEELNKNGITVLQPVGTDEIGVYVETVLLHESGEFIADKMRLAVKQANDPQAQGSAITYARRYGLQSMVFIPAEDDDAEKATEHKAPAQQTGSVGFQTRGEQIQNNLAEQIANHEANCSGEQIEIRKSQSTANYGREYNFCKECNSFVGWVAKAA